MIKPCNLPTNLRVAHQIRVIAELVEEKRYGAAWDELRDAMVEMMELSMADEPKVIADIPSASPVRRHASALTQYDPGRARFETIDELMRRGWSPMFFGGSGILVSKLPETAILCRRIRAAKFGDDETIASRVRDAERGAIPWMHLLPNRGVIGDT